MIKTFLLIIYLSTFSAALKVTDFFPILKLQNQFDKKIVLPMSEDKIILISFEKKTSQALNQLIQTKESSFLQNHHIKYISDVSTVPLFLFKVFAQKKLKKLPFDVYLIQHKEGKSINKKQGKISLFRLKNKKIINIQFIDIKELDTFL